MKATRYAVSPADFTAIQDGSKTALIIEDEGVAEGDELILVKTVEEEYQGPNGIQLARITHVDRTYSFLTAKALCLVSLKKPGERVSVVEVPVQQPIRRRNAHA